jgi:hypothetical protein
MMTTARSYRWWRVCGRSYVGGAVYVIGWFLAGSRRAAIERARRKHSGQLYGLKLEAH